MWSWKFQTRFIYCRLIFRWSLSSMDEDRSPIKRPFIYGVWMLLGCTVGNIAQRQENEHHCQLYLSHHWKIKCIMLSIFVVFFYECSVDTSCKLLNSLNMFVFFEFEHCGRNSQENLSSKLQRELRHFRVMASMPFEVGTAVACFFHGDLIRGNVETSMMVEGWLCTVTFR